MKTMKYDIFQIVKAVRGKEWIKVWFDVVICRNENDSKRLEKKAIDEFNKLKKDYPNETFSVLLTTEEEIEFKESTDVK